MTSDELWPSGLEPIFSPISLSFRRVVMFNSLMLPRKASIQEIVNYFALSDRKAYKN